MSVFAAPFVAGMTWDAVSERLARGAGALLPIGAGAKQHGLHLPMGTDALQAARLAEMLASKFDLLVWPVLVYGHYPAFSAYAGSVSLQAETFAHLVRDLVHGLAAYRPAAIFVLDTGISTAELIAPVVRDETFAVPIAHLTPYDGPRYRAAADALAEQPFGSHADELETSLMLALAPELVAMDRAQGLPRGSRPGPGPLSPVAKPGSVHSPSGSYGDPAHATRDKGERLLAAMIEDLTQEVARVLGKSSA